ncbi:YhdP family protein [Aliirhizobium smilacinae]|uniref:DUF3971 domain-containing protein n=1 Tax=Aliirhizobium smilacinae TaxID=1395944 RepID=A0A5C4XHB4_9HYPH|nr:DUF3971 domain-containing protein [Rhizobium smilacinae]TNM62020.1 DUF3971 domain-containing protein [Rhizobium smilacinae]
MAEIRGEKIDFGRKDIVPLHELPSAQTEDPIIVHCPPHRTRTWRFCKTVALFVVLIMVAVGSAVFAIEGGIVDGTLTSRAQSALNNAIGPRYISNVGSTAIRFDSDFRLAIEARDVDIVERATGQHLSRAGALRMAVDPLALLGGRISINSIAAQSIRLETAQLPEGDPIALAKVRVDAVPQLLEQAFQRLDEARGLIERTGTASIRLAGIEIVLPAAPERSPTVLKVNDLQLARNAEGEIGIDGTISINDRKAKLTAASKTVDGVTAALSAHLSGLEVTQFLLKRTEDGQPREGLESSVDFDMSAERSRGDAQKPAMSATLTNSPGNFYFDGIQQTFSGATINVAYDFAKDSIEILKSEASFGPTILPFTGAVIDLNRLNQSDTRLGFGLDVLIRGGKAIGASQGEQPADFDLKATGRYLSSDRQLEFDEMTVASPLGHMAAALKVRFGKQSPEISFGGQLPQMQVTGIKQLWPFWMARKPRDWVMANLFGGNVTNGTIAVFIPAGRMKGPGIPMELDANELQISFGITDSRLNLPGEVPPLRDLAGKFSLKGEDMVVDVSKAASYAPSGRVVSVESGRFAIPSTYAKPLMADLTLKIAGQADAITELANFAPMNALKGTNFKPGDFSGNARADIQARFGLISDHHPPKPIWNAQIRLDGVNLATPMEGHKIGGLIGMLAVDNQAARLSANGTIDDIPAELSVTEPVDANSTVKRERIIKATLNNSQRDKLVPGLSDLVDGPIVAELTRLDEKRQSVTLDLSRSSLTVPWIGWTKGSGIGSKAQFEVSTGAAKEIALNGFQLSGDSFGVKGDLQLSDGALKSASFSHVQLSPADNYSVSVKRSKGAYDIAIGGSSVDLRPIITMLRANSTGGGSTKGSGDGGSASLRAQVDRVVGFNDESLSNVALNFSSRGSNIVRADMSSVTASGQALVTQMSRGDTISVTSGDAGAVARFTDLYDNLRAGLLNLKLKARGNDWVGSLDIRNFQLANEQRLQSLVSSPVGQDGESLNSAVKKDIDVSSARFQRGFAALVYREGALSVANGVVRGEQIGATFQGKIRDANGNMDLTGTFMPAYGLNRLFGELPLIGAILGNGRDRGLLGITFKLDGPFEKPRLIVNPLSLIAPGVFRQIFEFQ